MFTSLIRLAASTLLGLASLGAHAGDTWPVSPSLLNLATPYGTLHIATSEYVYESALRVDDTDVEPAIRGILNITYAFDMPRARAALVSINRGNNGCPVMYRWIVLNEQGYKVSPEFGSCSDQIKVTASGRLFTMQTPNTQKPDKIDIYTYDGKTVKRRTAPQP